MQGPALDIKELIYQRFQPIFKAYDKDQNSTLEPNELRVLLADNLGVKQADISEDQLNWHFSRIDKDNDGKITFDQYFAHFFGDRAAKARTKQIEEKKEEKKEEKAASNEENEDDLIDINEFRKLMEDTFKPLNITITEEMVRWNFDKIDTDHSGRISFDEYMKFVKKYNS